MTRLYALCAVVGLVAGAVAASFLVLIADRSRA